MAKNIIYLAVGDSVKELVDLVWVMYWNADRVRICQAI